MFVSPEALRLQKEALWIEHGCRSDELEELVRTVEQWAEGRQQGAFLKHSWALNTRSAGPKLYVCERGRDAK